MGRANAQWAGHYEAYTRIINGHWSWCLPNTVLNAQNLGIYKKVFLKTFAAFDTRDSKTSQKTMSNLNKEIQNTNNNLITNFIFIDVQNQTIKQRPNRRSNKTFNREVIK